MDPRTEGCIQACLDCHRACLETVSYLQAADLRIGVDQIRMLFNCAELCQTSANLLRGGVDATWRACADVCRRCASYCESFDDAVLRRCAEACRACAVACERVAAIAA